MEDATLTPFLDWYGIWPSHRKLEENGRIWSQSPPRGVCLRQEQAEKSQVFFHKERPWERESSLGINTIIYEDGRYRLWYSASKVEDVTRSCVCYAESADGFTWDRPDLGLVDYDGSTANNILCEAGAHHLGAVFADPSAPSAVPSSI